MNRTGISRLKIVIAMFIYGTIGLFVRYIPLPSSVTANARGIIGSLFLLSYTLLRGRKFSSRGIRQNLKYLIISGFFLGFNWILLFEAYRFTSVASATLCYYLAPIIIVAVSPVVFREKLTLRKVLCVLVALLGMYFVSGFAGDSGLSQGNTKGLVLGVLAAVLYACIVLLNKKIVGIEPTERTIMQLAISAAVLLPYNIITVSAEQMVFTPFSVLMLIIVGIVHTGIAYLLYFGSIEHVPSQSAALLSYIDPVVAVLLSALVLSEPMTLGTAIGAVLIIGSAVISELPGK